ncbi:MAG: hypothetical protein A3C61_03660 [Candidatus Yanofskybacteria bacterium RIFCSPHIGHO2_02_FULL_39_10]|uniref:Right handed beta helix domain-containing protein n=1 Tax=Candidatus Yanofskybacteria bacterium RIFCSPHIGHO2_02_FULL_39_10 TaxID=1802674 RepID=A0A1F8F5I4_9BACT|nr:MAG: hypothetical protein A3C61_03660 [Candidatus Yanofskybacteria bacterium RIFCSPHIGHO2_02_FULL_39_10]
MKSAWKALFTLFVLCSMVIACDQNRNPFQPTSSDSNSGGVSDGQGVLPGSVSDTSADLGVMDCGNPDDLLPDDSFLQNCLNRGGEIRIKPGSPGYIVNGLNGDVRRGLWITKPGTILTSSTPGTLAKIIAGEDLFGHILQTDPSIRVDDFTIEYILFSGMVDERNGTYRINGNNCTGDDDGHPGNLVLSGNNFNFRNNHSIQALCGSGLAVYGANFTIENNHIAYNGRDKLSGVAGVPWSDGMTVLQCVNGSIINNTFVDNTDIDLALGGGSGCRVEGNTISHWGKYGFAGLHIGNFAGPYAGNHIGSIYSGNEIFSGVPNKLAMGINVGSHPWNSSVHVYNAGRVVGNKSYDNVMNLVVDGVGGGEISGNEIYNSIGNDGMGSCREPEVNYGVNPAHVINTILQEGWIALLYDDNDCKRK